MQQRISGNGKGKRMPQDGGLAEVIAHTNGRGRAAKADYSKVLIWDTLESLDQWTELVTNPPLHSVVAWIDPVAAKGILSLANEGNRPLNKGSIANLVAEHQSGNFGYTGDTLKFSKKGRLLDGQYRLSACVEANKGFQTHIVFGLDEAVFDILDRQRTRTPGDILAIAEVRDPLIVAGAVRWVISMTEGHRGITNRGMTPRKIRELATGPMKDVARYTRQSEEIRAAYGIPPTMCAALLYLISRNSKATAESFIQDWLHGNRNYIRNKAFDVLASRIQTCRKQNNGSMNRHVLAAMLVQAFNYWHANVAATPRALTWSKDYQFPSLAFDKEAFQHSLERRRASDTSLPEVQLRMLKAMASLRNDAGNVQANQGDLSKASGIHKSQVGYILGTLKDAEAIQMLKPPINKLGQAAIWRIRSAGEARLKADQ